MRRFGRAPAASVRDPLQPLAVLPIGTANNIAASLGIATDLDEAIAAWATSRVQPLDLGVATGPWGERRFVESVGGGLVTHGIVVMDRQPWLSGTGHGAAGAVPGGRIDPGHVRGVDASSASIACGSIGLVQ